MKRIIIFTLVFSIFTFRQLIAATGNMSVKIVSEIRAQEKKVLNFGYLVAGGEGKTIDQYHNHQDAGLIVIYGDRHENLDIELKPIDTPAGIEYNLQMATEWKEAVDSPDASKLINIAFDKADNVGGQDGVLKIHIFGTAQVKKNAEAGVHNDTYQLTINYN